MLLAPLAAKAEVASGARWIAPDAAGSPGVYDFRKLLSHATVPAHELVHVSADNRFQLYINGQRVGEGPARGDLQHWRYETFDLAPYLHRGVNVIAARVWNFGELAPSAQISLRTGLLLWSDEPGTTAILTDSSWQVRSENAWRYKPTGPPLHTIVGPNEEVDGGHYDWQWTTANDSSEWRPVTVLDAPTFASDLDPAPKAAVWQLVPDPLPPMTYTLDAAGKVVRSEGVAPGDFPAKGELRVPSHTHTSVLLDHGVLTTGYPQLTIAGGAGTRVRLSYAEALYDEHGDKGNRNVIVGKHMDLQLLHDTFTAGDGMAPQTFEPLWWRTWRYLQLDVDTEDQPVTVVSLRSEASSYPLQERASFQSSDPQLKQIWDVGWRTLRVDAHETYMDCPFYEQTQYIGDSRVEALVTYAMSGDDRLARQALLAFADSALPSGLTHSSYPVRGVQIIPPFSLLWVGMLHDFWMYRPESDRLVREMLPTVRHVLEHFRQLQTPSVLLGKLPQDGFGLWNFLDWTAPYPIGAPPEDAQGGSVPLSLQLAAALQETADLEASAGDASRATQDREDAERITAAAFKEAWDERTGLLADTPARTSFSQHANILGVLTGAIPMDLQKAVMHRVLQQGLEHTVPTGEPTLAPASYYFRFYLARALDRAGMDDSYLQTLDPWRTMLGLGLTTWAEQPEPTRSDAHAWSSHPNFDLLTLVAGIRPDAPGFSRVLIRPHLGTLTSLDASMPHPLGDIHVRYRRIGRATEATIDLPSGLTGNFELGSFQRPLHSGTQRFRVEDTQGSPTTSAEVR